MKLEYTVRAPRQGTVSELTALPGDQVQEGQLLFVVGEAA